MSSAATMEASTTAPTSRIDFSQPVDISQLFPAIEQALLERGIDVGKMPKNRSYLGNNMEQCRVFFASSWGGLGLWRGKNYKELSHFFEGDRKVELGYWVSFPPTQPGGPRPKSDDPRVKEVGVTLIEYLEGYRQGSLSFTISRKDGDEEVRYDLSGNRRVITSELNNAVKENGGFGNVINLFADAFASTYQKKKEPAVSRAV